ncbi:MAG TPA: HAMP domain-containing sensor histidine kinase [Myxococcota bacterium]|nr:HAMP domain-containing sensor histidine kinase [Myxococcota bacterium]
MRPRRRSIRLRLAVASAALLTAMAALVLAAVYWLTLDALDARVDDQMEHEIESLVEEHRTVGLDGLVAEVRRRSQRSGNSFYLVTEEIHGSLAGNWPKDAETGRDGELTFGEEVNGFHIVHRLRVESRDFSDGRRLLVGRDVSAEHAFEGNLRIALIGAFAFALLFAIGAGLAISDSLLRRVNSMNATIGQILAGHAKQRVPVRDTGDEFEVLAGRFNALLDENDRLLAQIRSVTDDIAHDLRTPLARMRTRIESALGACRDPAAADALHALFTETSAILDTFNALLRIAQVESGALQGGMAEVAFGEIVRGAAELYAPVAEEAGLAFEVDVADGLRVRGDRHLLAQAVANLLDNAVKYGRGRVRVAASARGDHVELVVEDAGPGIPDADRARVLERFVRLEPSRGTPGTGLGLAFVAAVARLHGAALSLEDAAPGLRVVWRMPAPGSREPARAV